MHNERVLIMKKSKIMRKLTSGMTAFAASAACLTSAFVIPQTAVASAPDDDNYAKLLQYSMYLYDGNMCGNDVAEKSGFSWRGNCHVDDEVPGGFHDCGDHVKFGITAGYSAATLGWSYYEYKDVFDELGQTGHLKLITDHFAKYFRDCTTLSGGTVTDFIYQIGDGGADHNSYWGPPEKQDSSSRKVFRTSSGASDIAAEYAAALAANYINFGNEEDLTYAKALWDFSCKGNQCAKEGTGGFYDSSSYLDDQSFAAGWLYLATKEEKYNTFLKANQKDPNWDYCWNNVYIGASLLNGEINDDWSIASKYAQQKYQNPEKWYVLDSWGAARYNTAAQFTGLLLTKYKQGDYSKWSKSQMAMILGDNPKNTCIVVGYNDISAKYPHHEAASGLSGWDEYNAAGATFGPKGGHILTGALEGGFQDAGFQFKDELNDITSSEVGIDYNATLVAAAAGLYSIYETGQIDSTVNGVDRDIAYENPNTTPGETRTTASKTTKVTTTTTTVPTSKRTEKVEVASGKKELDIKLNKAAAIEIGIKATPGVEFNGAFSYTDSSGQYGQFGNFSSTMGQDGIYKLSESLKGIDAMNDTVTFHIWYSKDDSAVVDSVALTYYDAVDTPKATTTTSSESAQTTTTTENNEPKSPDYYNLLLNIVDKETGKHIPDVKFKVTAVSKKDSSLTKSLNATTSDKTYKLNFGESDIHFIHEADCSIEIVSVPDGYAIPASPAATFDFSKATPEVTIKLESTAKTSTTQPSNEKGKVTLYGDANLDNKVTIADAVAILQSIANKDKYSLKPDGAANADVYNNGDGITGNDALTIQQVDAGKYKASDLPVSFKK